MKVEYSDQITDEQIILDTMGYSHYKQRMSSGNYSQVELRDIIKHRNDILNKYRDSNKSRIDRLFGMSRADGFFIPVDFDGAFVDADDVFAATYRMDFNFMVEKVKREQYVLWVLFTNDTYMPVLPLICYQKNSPWEQFTKKERNDYLEVIRQSCPNLKYPICEIEQFEEKVKLEHSIRGRVNKTFLLGQLYDAKNQIGLFDPQTISCEVGGLTRKILVENGYEVE